MQSHWRSLRGAQSTADGGQPSGGDILQSCSWLHTSQLTVQLLPAILDQTLRDVLLLHPQHHQEPHIHHLVHQVRTGHSVYFPSLPCHEK